MAKRDFSKLGDFNREKFEIATLISRLNPRFQCMKSFRGCNFLAVRLCTRTSKFLVHELDLKEFAVELVCQKN